MPKSTSKPSNNINLVPKVVLGVAAHPDDLDFGAAGTVAKWVSLGAEAYYLILTDGSKGSSNRQLSSSDLIIMRRKEQKNAANILGVKRVFFCDYEDGHLRCDMAAKRDIARVIRKVKPDVVITMDPTMVYSLKQNFINHPDHRAAGQATLDAVFPLARDHLTFPELLGEGLEPHNTPTLLLINFDKSNFFVDITDSLDRKMKALAAHPSQMDDIKKVQAYMTNAARELGKQASCDYAEGFIRLEVSSL